MNWREMWRRMVGVDEREYVRRLEAEVGRLRAENRALLNSILGIAGVPPVMVEKQDGESFHGRPGLNDGQVKPNGSAVGSGAPVEATRSARDAALDGEVDATPILKKERKISRSNTGMGAGKIQELPVKRKRSWQQVSKMLEIDSAAKKKTE